ARRSPPVPLAGSLRRPVQRALRRDGQADGRAGWHALDREDLVTADVHDVDRLMELVPALQQADREVCRDLRGVVDVVDVAQDDRSGEGHVLEMTEVGLSVEEEDR